MPPQLAENIAPREIACKYVVIWRKVGGGWKLTTDIWNTNK